MSIVLPLLIAFAYCVAPFTETTLIAKIVAGDTTFKGEFRFADGNVAKLDVRPRCNKVGVSITPKVKGADACFDALVLKGGVSKLSQIYSHPNCGKGKTLLNLFVALARGVGSTSAILADASEFPVVRSMVKSRIVMAFKNKDVKHLYSYYTDAAGFTYDDQYRAGITAAVEYLTSITIGTFKEQTTIADLPEFPEAVNSQILHQFLQKGAAAFIDKFLAHYFDVKEVDTNFTPGSALLQKVQELSADKWMSKNL